MAEEKHLFDTDVITNIFKPFPSKKLLRRLGPLAGDRQFISTITLGEIIYGALKSGRPEYHLKNLETVLLPKANLLTFDSRAAFHYGRLRAEQEKKGKPLNHADLQIAAIAFANDMILITGNTKHFSLIEGMRIENWL